MVRLSAFILRPTTSLIQMNILKMFMSQVVMQCEAAD